MIDPSLTNDIGSRISVNCNIFTLTPHRNFKTDQPQLKTFLLLAKSVPKEKNCLSVFRDSKRVSKSQNQNFPGHRRIEKLTPPPPAFKIVSKCRREREIERKKARESERERERERET